MRSLGSRLIVRLWGRDDVGLAGLGEAPAAVRSRRSRGTAEFGETLEERVCSRTGGATCSVGPQRDRRGHGAGHRGPRPPVRTARPRSSGRTAGPADGAVEPGGEVGRDRRRPHQPRRRQPGHRPGGHPVDVKSLDAAVNELATAIAGGDARRRRPRPTSRRCSPARAYRGDGTQAFTDLSKAITDSGVTADRPVHRRRRPGRHPDRSANLQNGMGEATRSGSGSARAGLPAAAHRAARAAAPPG